MLKIKSNKKLMIPIAVLLLLVVLAGSALAYSGSYSFCIIASVTGSTTHTLSGDSSADITGEAVTLNMDYSLSTKVSTYQSGIWTSGWLLRKYSDVWDADNSYNSHTFTSSQLKDGTYNIKVIKNDGNATYVDGSGELTQ